MKVYINKRSGDYGYTGGLIVVAANSPQEAHGVMCDSERGDDYIDYYEAAGWQLLANVVANVEQPTILAEHGYTE